MRRRFLESLRGVTALSVIWICMGPGRAQASLLVNGGFESPAQAPGAARTFASGQTLPLVALLAAAVGSRRSQQA